MLTLTVSCQEVETDGPRSGHISNIEPLYSSVREGRSRPSTLFFSIELILYSLSHQQLQIFLTLLGSNLPEKQTEISVEDLKKEILSWKSVNVRQEFYQPLSLICIFRAVDCLSLSLSWSNLS